MRILKPALALFLIAQIVACDNPADNAQRAKVETPSGGKTVSSAESGKKLSIKPESKVEFVGSKVTGSHNGGFKKVDGFVTATPDGKDLAGVEVTIDMTSTYTDNDKLTGHLKNSDFFDVEKHPTAVFKSTSIRKGATAAKMPDATHTVTGDLTLHGVTKAITFATKIAQDGPGFQATSELSIDRNDFGIKFPGMPNDLIRNDVLIRLDIRV
jgi:polyisoprenoid-binding protein YceI